MTFQRIKGIVSFAVLVILLVGTLVFVNQISQSSIAPAESDAIYGGQLESGYPYSGYMIVTKSDGRISICSTTYLAPNVTISAAHCVFEDATTYVGEGQFRVSQDDNYIVRDIETKPGWDGRTSNNDLSILKLGSKTPLLSDFAEIASPQLGCNYIVVGYGRTENDLNGLDLNRPRKSTRVCITKIETDLVSLTGEGGGICFGDSGSPIFEAGTNKIVAVISAITAAPGETKASCKVDNTAVAVRIDRNLTFVANTAGTIGKPVAADALLCGQNCSGNRTCASGLICGTNGRCELPSGGCESVVGKLCGDKINVGCNEGATCLANLCRDIAVIAANDQPDITAAVQGFINTITTSNLVLVFFGSIMIVLGIVFVLKQLLKQKPAVVIKVANSQSLAPVDLHQHNFRNTQAINNDDKHDLNWPRPPQPPKESPPLVV